MIYNNNTVPGATQEELITLGTQTTRQTDFIHIQIQIGGLIFSFKVCFCQIHEHYEDLNEL